MALLEAVTDRYSSLPLLKDKVSFCKQVQEQSIVEPYGTSLHDSRYVPTRFPLCAYNIPAMCLHHYRCVRSSAACGTELQYAATSGRAAGHTHGMAQRLENTSQLQVAATRGTTIALSAVGVCDTGMRSTRRTVLT